MYQIEKDRKNIPKILYKYRPFNEFAKRMLSKGEIYFAIINQLKDQNERKFRFTNGAWVNLNNQPNCLNPEQYTQYILETIRAGELEQHGIFSLCESKLEKRMYEEYADNFKGICIGFDWDAFGLFFDGSCPPVRNFPRKVIYQPLVEIQTLHPTPNQYIEIFTSKLPQYSYEKEYRMFYKKGILAMSTIRYAIKEIIFGHNIAPEQMLEIKDWIKDLRNVALYTTRLVGKKVQIDQYNY